MISDIEFGEKLRGGVTTEETEIGGKFDPNNNIYTLFQIPFETFCFYIS